MKWVLYLWRTDPLHTRSEHDNDLQEYPQHHPVGCRGAPGRAGGRSQDREGDGHRVCRPGRDHPGRGEQRAPVERRGGQTAGPGHVQGESQDLQVRGCRWGLHAREWDCHQVRLSSHLFCRLFQLYSEKEKFHRTPFRFLIKIFRVETGNRKIKIGPQIPTIGSLTINTGNIQQRNGIRPIRIGSQI